jgi:hypothetical protein
MCFLRQLPNRDAELLRWSKLAAAGLASYGERRAEARAAARAAGAHLAPALRASGRQLGLELLEVTLHEAATQAERDPVAQCLAPLLTKPVGCASHALDCTQAAAAED